MTAPVLMQGDCLEAMWLIPEDSVDMILCDPPYGTTQNRWDSVIPFEPLWTHYWRVLKPNGAVVLTAAQPFTSALVMSQPENFRHDWVWLKNKASGHLNANRRPMRIHEDVLVFCRQQPTYNPQKTEGHKPGNYAKRAAQSSNYGQADPTEYGGQTSRFPKTSIFSPVVNNDSLDRLHPTQKPVALMEYLIKTYTHEGETVLDNCMGSGTTGVAARNTGRNFIGIERDPEYFKIAQSRILSA